ncbi:hypothetical protein FRAHR75_860010 [Frankia sp. Hr75.2]|nr:hypothetical protein FRAHR75_860010 [Frankia sp. Hr75.2]SQE00642.1 hypothetical protein FMEAI12_6880009 [Parafrankia sp. Ea1.12]
MSLRSFPGPARPVGEMVGGFALRMGTEILLTRVSTHRVDDRRRPARWGASRTGGGSTRMSGGVCAARFGSAGDAASNRGRQTPREHYPRGATRGLRPAAFRAVAGGQPTGRQSALATRRRST